MYPQPLLWASLVLIESLLLSSDIRGQTPQPTTDRPNVILIMTDDQGYGELSVHGNPILKTPALDELHRTSVRFTDFHVAPMCTPTRGQLMTGIHAVKNGAANVSSGRTLLREDLKTMADYFAENGYTTGIFGKWHLGDNYPYRPQDRGFNKSLWFPSSHIGAVPDYWGNDYFDDVYIEDGERKKFSGFCTNVFFEEAKDWIAQCTENDQPFFTYIPTNAPHSPFYAPEADIQEMETLVQNATIDSMEEGRKHNLVRYLAMIRNIDYNVGELMSFLEERELSENTIVVFLTDNGSTFGPEYFNAGMRGRKTQLYEGGHRVPLFIRWAGGDMMSPRDIDGLTQVQDVLPTLMDLCGLSVPENLDGISLVPALTGNEEVDRERVAFINYSRMPFPFTYPSPYSTSTIRKKESAVLWKEWRMLNGNELYNLRQDPRQETNLMHEHPEIARRMSSQLDEWWSTEVEPVVNEPQSVTVGSRHENPTLLSACEWWDVFLDTQVQVRRGALKNGYWHLEVDQPGTYEFELRRWPKETSAPVSQAHDGGKALPIARARLFIRTGKTDIEKTAAIADDDVSAVFTVDLGKGPAVLHTWFDNEENESLLGAYYVYVSRK